MKAVGFAAAVGGLAPSTAYHFRAVSENAGGVSFGADQTFTTATPPPPSIAGATQSHSRWREGSALDTNQPTARARGHDVLVHA